MTVVSPYPWAPGFYPPATAGDRPQVVTSRFQYDDAYTLDRYHATGGYEGLKAALAKTPAARLPGRNEVGVHAAGRVAALPRGERRRIRAGHLQGPPPHGVRPAPT